MHFMYCRFSLFCIFRPYVIFIVFCIIVESHVARDSVNMTHCDPVNMTHCDLVNYAITAFGHTNDVSARNNGTIQHCKTEASNKVNCGFR
jgi:hypothetical protein